MITIRLVQISFRRALAIPDIQPTDPSKGVDSAECQQVYATEARTPNQAIAKVRPLAKGRRLQAFLTTEKYWDELADAR